MAMKRGAQKDFMKKTFELIHPKVKYPRMVEAARRDINRYVKRENRRTLPEDADYWDFDCRFGDTEATAEPIHLSAFTHRITDAAARELPSFYVEILAKPATRTRKPGGPVADQVDESSDPSTGTS